ncbi:MAG: flagellar biosynthesis anti-sigma factor FlgM [Oscillospiraceae bacterium]
MKINGNSINALNAYIHTANEIVSKKSTEKTGRRNVDTVEFSQAGKAAGSMTSSTAAKRNEAVRAARDTASPERIAALKASVDSGSYHVSSEKIASAILNG